MGHRRPKHNVIRHPSSSIDRHSPNEVGHTPLANVTHRQVTHPRSETPTYLHVTGTSSNMKFYPLKNWWKGQDTIVINKGKYYTLEGAMAWELDQKEEEKVTLATHEGELWLKKWGGIPPVVAGKSQKDKTWIHNMLTDENTTAVMSLHPEVMIVAPTLSGHQDAGTIFLDPVARKQDKDRKKWKKPEEKKEKEREKKSYSEPPHLSQDLGKEPGKKRWASNNNAQHLRTATPLGISTTNLHMNKCS